MPYLQEHLEVPIGFYSHIQLQFIQRQGFVHKMSLKTWHLTFMSAVFPESIEKLELPKSCNQIAPKSYNQNRIIKFLNAYYRLMCNL